MAIFLSEMEEQEGAETCFLLPYTYTKVVSDTWKETRAKPIGNTFINSVGVDRSAIGSRKRSNSWSHSVMCECWSPPVEGLQCMDLRTENTGEEHDEITSQGASDEAKNPSMKIVKPESTHPAYEPENPRPFWQADTGSTNDAENLLLSDALVQNGKQQFGQHRTSERKSEQDPLEATDQSSHLLPLEKPLPVGFQQIPPRYLPLRKVARPSDMDEDIYLPTDLHNGSWHQSLCSDSQVPLCAAPAASADAYPTRAAPLSPGVVHPHIHISCNASPSMYQEENSIPKLRSSQVNHQMHCERANPNLQSSPWQPQPNMLSPTPLAHQSTMPLHTSQSTQQIGELNSMPQVQQAIPQVLPQRAAAVPPGIHTDTPLLADFNTMIDQLKAKATAVPPPLRECVPMAEKMYGRLQNNESQPGSQTPSYAASARQAEALPVGPCSTSEHLLAPCSDSFPGQKHVDGDLMFKKQWGPSEAVETEKTLRKKEDIGFSPCCDENTRPMRWADAYESPTDEDTLNEEAPQEDEMIRSQSMDAENHTEIPEGCTLMIRNISEYASTTQLLSAIEDLGLGGNLQCLYMPQMFRECRRKNNSYAFVNFDTTEAAEMLIREWHNNRVSFGPKSNNKAAPKRYLNIGLANVQGLRENLQAWGKSKTSRIRNSNFKPVLLNAARQLQF